MPATTKGTTDRMGRHEGALRPDRRAGDADDRGEGIISTAIAVLIMAGLGALMWVGFQQIWQDTEANTRDKVSEIGG